MDDSNKMALGTITGLDMNPAGELVTATVVDLIQPVNAGLHAGEPEAYISGYDVLAKRHGSDSSTYLSPSVTSAVEDDETLLGALSPTDGTVDQESALPPRPSDPPNSQDWENHRPLFTKLYRAEGRTLRDAKALMEQRYNFFASERMYKKRIAEWGLQKYSSRGKRRPLASEADPYPFRPSAQAREALRRHRSASREHSPFGGSTGDCNGNCDDQVLIAVDAQRMDRALDAYICSQYPTMSLARFRAMSLDLRNVEIILTLVDDYYNSFSLDKWQRKFPKIARGCIKEIPLCFDTEMKGERTPRPKVRHPGELFNRIHMAAELLKMKTSETNALAWQIMEEAFEMVKDVVQQEHPQLLRYLFREYWDINFDAHPQIRQQLFALIASFASLYFGPRHPIGIISRLLPQSQDTVQVSELAWERQVDTFDSLLGTSHDEALRSKMSLTGNYIDVKRYDDAERILWKVIHTFEPESTAYYKRAALCRLAWVYSLQGRYLEAEPFFVDVLQRCMAVQQESGEEPKVMDEVYLAATVHLAKIRARREYAQGEVMLRDLLELCTMTMGSTHAYTYTIQNEIDHLQEVAQVTGLFDGVELSA